MIRVVVVEDEPLAQQYLSALLAGTGQVEVCGAASTAAAGLQLCTDLQPDAVFLDVRLPGSDGVTLASRLAAFSCPPLLVFVTGYADRAHDAFRVEAVDYLLKPIESSQVGAAVERVARRLSDRERPAAAENKEPGGVLQSHLPVRVGHSDVIKMLTRNDIVAALSRNRRTWIHTAGGEYATYYPLSSLARWLGGMPFVQIAREAIINLDAVAEVVHYGDRLYQVRLRDRSGTVVEASRSGATRLTQYLKPPI